MLIDGYQAWSYVDLNTSNIGQGYNYEGTMTRGATINPDPPITSCGASVRSWCSSNGGCNIGPTIYAEADDTGGHLLSSNAEVRLTAKTGKFFYNSNGSGTFV